MLNIEEENDLFLLCIKDGTLKIGDSTKNRMFTIVQNDFDLGLGFAKLQACKLHSLHI